MRPFRGDRQSGSAAGEEGGCRRLPTPASRDPHFLPRQPLVVAPAPKPAVSHANPAITAALSGLGITAGCQTQTAAGATRPPPTPGRDITLHGEMTRQEPPGLAEDGSAFPEPWHHGWGCDAGSCIPGAAALRLRGSLGVPSPWSGSSAAGRATHLQLRCPHRCDHP